jgi:flagellar protein FliO/FliZ
MSPRAGRRTKSLAIAAIALVALPSLALAADPGSPPSLSDAVVRTVASLGAVLALIVLLAFLFKRFREQATQSGGGGRLVEIARLDLGSRREIRLVRVADRQLVVGITAERMQLLAELPAEGAEADEDADAGLRILRKLATSS